MSTYQANTDLPPSGSKNDAPKATLPRRKSGASRPLLLAASAGVVVAGLIFLLSDSAGFEYYKHVDEVMKDPATWQNKRLQLHGFVVPGSIMKRLDRDHQKLEYKFQVENCGSITEARFAGVVPDTFKEGAEVVLKGQMQGQAFHTSEVMAKCPSKYAKEGVERSAMVTRCSREGAGTASSPSGQ